MVTRQHMTCTVCRRNILIHPRHSGMVGPVDDRVCGGHIQRRNPCRYHTPHTPCTLSVRNHAWFCVLVQLAGCVACIHPAQITGVAEGLRNDGTQTYAGAPQGVPAKHFSQRPQRTQPLSPTPQPHTCPRVRPGDSIQHDVP
jgi:hypothetical protein